MIIWCFAYQSCGQHIIICIIFLEIFDQAISCRCIPQSKKILLGMINAPVCHILHKYITATMDISFLDINQDIFDFLFFFTIDRLMIGMRSVVKMYTSTQLFDSVHIVYLFIFHQKFDRISSCTTSKTFINLFLWWYNKRWTLFIVKWTQSREIWTSFFEWYMATYDIDDINSTQYLFTQYRHSIVYFSYLQSKGYTEKNPYKRDYYSKYIFHILILHLFTIHIEYVYKFVCTWWQIEPKLRTNIDSCRCTIVDCLDLLCFSSCKPLIDIWSTLICERIDISCRWDQQSVYQ